MNKEGSGLPVSLTPKFKRPPVAAEVDLPRRLPDFAFILLITYFWGLVGHAYGLLNGFYSHDVLNALMADGAEEVWKVQLGRFLVPIYRYVIRSNVTLPWLIGLIALFYIACAVYCTVKILNISSRISIFFIAAIFSVNITTSALVASYLYEFDFDMLAMLFAALAVFCWKKRCISFYVLAVVLLSCSMALYQAYYAFAAGLFLIAMISDLMRSRSRKKVVYDGLVALAILLLSAVVYALLLNLVSALTDIPLVSGYNGIGSMFAGDFSLQLFVDCYEYYFWQMCQLIPEYSQTMEFVIQLLIFLGLVVKISFLYRQKKLVLGDLFLLLVIGLLLPLAVNGIYILSGGMVHQLMIYSFYLPILLIFVESRLDLKKFGLVRYKKLVNYLKYALVFLFIWGNIVSANVLYTKKDLETRAVYARMIDLNYRLSTLDDYQVGISEVAFVGEMSLDYLDLNLDYYMVAGSDMYSAIPRYGHDFYDTYKTYYKYIFQERINLAPRYTCMALTEDPRVRGMPTYPDKNSVQIIDGIYVVKLSD